MKRLIISAALILAASQAMATDYCHVLVSNTANDAGYTISFNVTNVSEGSNGATYNYGFVGAGQRGDLAVPCDALYSIAATPTAAATNLQSTLNAKGSLRYTFGNVYLASPDGAITVNYPDDFQLTE